MIDDDDNGGDDDSEAMTTTSKNDYDDASDIPGLQTQHPLSQRPWPLQSNGSHL